MEKRTPHTPLSVICGLVEEGKVRSTWSALTGAAQLDVDFPAMCAIVLALKPSDFYKSMTTHADHRIWQDVYRPQTAAAAVYLKLTVDNEVLIVSFKEL